MISIHKRALAGLLALSMMMLLFIGWPIQTITALVVGVAIGLFCRYLDSWRSSPGIENAACYRHQSRADRSRLAHERAARFHNQFATKQINADWARFAQPIQTVGSSLAHWLKRTMIRCTAGRETYYAMDSPRRNARTPRCNRYHISADLAGVYG